MRGRGAACYTSRYSRTAWCSAASTAASRSGSRSVWGVLNIINILHGSLIILGSYVAFFAYQYLHVDPFLFVPRGGGAAVRLGYAIQPLFINRVMGSPVLITLTLTFGLIWCSTT